MSLKSYNTPVQIGQIWQETDGRFTNSRIVRVICVENGKAVVQPKHGGRTTRIRLDRMYPHSTGWRLIEEGKAPIQADAASLQKRQHAGEGKAEDARLAMFAMEREMKLVRLLDRILNHLRRDDPLWNDYCTAAEYECKGILSPRFQAERAPLVGREKERED